MCARVQLAEGREICRIRYVSRENEESATSRCVKTTNCYTTAGWTWPGDAVNQSETRYTLTWFP